MPRNAVTLLRNGPVGIKYRRAHRRGADADAKPLDGPRQNQLPDVPRLREQDHCGRVQQQRREDHRAASDIVGQPADRQQGREQAGDVTRKYDRDPERREVHGRLIEMVKRCHRAAARRDQHRTCETEHRHGAG
jgi:hypothetical protein